MKLVLLYRDSRRDAMPPSEVARRMSLLFDPLHEGLGEPVVRESSAGALVVMEMPVRNCRVRFVQEDDLTWAVAPDYPIDLERALATIGKTGHDSLPALCRVLEERPGPLLRELAPPFGAVWFAKDRDEIRVQVDGLGRAQLFEHGDADCWALSNRPLAFRALGLPLTPEPLDWAIRWCVSHFVAERSGFREVRMLEPAMQLRLRPEALTRQRHDVLAHWLAQPVGSANEAAEAAGAALVAQAEAGLATLDEPRLGLSGGLDSRVLAACLHHRGIAFEAQVRGEEWRADVRIAREIARRAGADLRVKSRSGLKLPPDDEAGCRDSIRNSLLAFAGGRTAQSYKTYFADKRLRPGRAELTGHGGELARSFYASRVRGEEVEDADERLVRHLWKRKAPPFLLPALEQEARHAVLERCRRASALGLEGAARWDHFYLCERERRFIGSHGAARTALEVMPFLAPGFLRATFRLPPADKASDRIHHALLARLVPDWSDVPFSKQVRERPPESPQRTLEPGVPTWRRPEGRHAYDNRRYWRDVGRPLVDSCLDGRGLCSSVFDLERARAEWHEASDELVITDLLGELLDEKAPGAP